MLAGLLGFTWAQGRGALNADEPKPVAGDLAVVDLAKVFNEHKALQAKIADINREAQRAEEEVKTMAEAVKELETEFKSAKPGSAEQGRIQKEAQEKLAAFNKFRTEKQKQFNEERAQAYLTIYQSVMEEIQRIAENRGFKLVLNFSSEPIDPKDVNKTMQVLSRQVLYQNGIDITEDVLQVVN